jgi:hypothetical protein
MWRDLDEVPNALLAEHIALEAEYLAIKDLRGDDPRAVAYLLDRRVAHGERIIDFADRVGPR